MVSVTNDWHKLILVYIAGRKTQASPENIKQYLKKHGISKSHTAITTACKKSLSDTLICHDFSSYNDDGTVRQQRFRYSVKNDLPTLQIIADSFNNNDLQRKFMKLPFYLSWIPELTDRFDDAKPFDELTNSPTISTNLHGFISRQVFAEELTDEERINPRFLHFVVYGIKNVNGNFLVAYGTTNRIITKEDEIDEIVSNIAENCCLTQKHREFLENHLKADMRGLELNDSTIVINHRMTDADKKCLMASLKDNWLAFNFVIHFINADYDEKIRMMSQITSGASDWRISPSTAYGRGWCDALKHLMKKGKITEEEAVRASNGMHTPRYTIDWSEVFNQLNHYNSIYRFLFD